MCETLKSCWVIVRDGCCGSGWMRQALVGMNARSALQDGAGMLL